MNQNPHRTQHHRRQQGFTLVEIMVVIVILGLLATIVGTNVLKSRDHAEIQKAQTDVKEIEHAIEMYMLTSRSHDLPTLEQLTTKGEKDNKAWLTGETTDPWGQQYIIRALDRGEYEVLSCGPDKSEGTEDDISSKKKDSH